MTPIEKATKRSFDFAASAVGLAVLWPAMAAIGLAIKLDDPGPAIYEGRRAGRLGHAFKMLKFRTMVSNAESLGGTTTGANDPRVTRVGRFLRAYKLDELPQLWNVLVGEMSFVGPRPEVYEYVDAYTSDERAILDVRPGITDLSSLEFVNLQAHVGEDDPDEVFRRDVLPRKIELRLKYVREQSLGLDARILGRTIATLARRALRRRR